MDFSLSEEQQMIVKTTRDFVVNELYPHEAEIEETGVLRPELRDAIRRRQLQRGSMPPTCQPRSEAPASIR